MASPRAGGVAGFEAGADGGGELGGVQPGDLGAAEGAEEAGFDLAGEVVQDAGAAERAAAGASGVAADGVLGADDGEERLGADGGRLEGVVEQVVQVGGQLGFAGLPVGVHPVVALGAVVGDGADLQGEVVDLAARGAGLEELGESRAHQETVGVVGHPDAGVVHAGGHRPGAGGEVLDERGPLESAGQRRSVVEADAGQDARQVGLVDLLLGRGGVESGGGGAPGGPPACAANGVSDEDADPLRGRPASDRDGGEQGDHDPAGHEDQQGDPATHRHGEPGRHRRDQQQGELGPGEAEEPAVPVAAGGSCRRRSCQEHRVVGETSRSAGSPWDLPVRRLLELDPGARAEASGGCGWSATPRSSLGAGCR